MAGKKRVASGSGPTRPVGKKIRVGAVRIKDDPNAAIDASQQQKTLKEQFISLLSEPKNRGGISNKEIQKRFKDPEQQKYIVQVINELSEESRLQMSKLGNELYYMLLDGEVAQKYQGLDFSAKMVLQVIEKAGNKGIWTKDIQLSTNIALLKLKKIFKQLEGRSLIKPVRSVANKKKLFYILFDLQPSAELTGGVWYSNLDFDHEFVSSLRIFIMKCVESLNKLNKGKGVTLSEIRSKMIERKVSKVELSMDEVKQLVKTLVYDHHIEEKDDVESSGAIRYFVAPKRISTTTCEFKWWDALSPDFHFRAIEFEDGVTLAAHEPHHHSG